MFWRSIISFITKHKLLLSISLGMITVGTIIGLLFVNWNNLKIIYAAGSSAVAPLLEQLNLEYEENPKDAAIDMNVSPTGSGNGIEVAARGTKHLGNVSRSPRVSEAGAPSINDEPAISGTYSNQWEQRKLKTITWGWDAIAIVYKPRISNFELDINASNIVKLYETISGLNSNTLSSLNGSGSNNDNTTIIPYARTGGAIKSGTTEAFIKSSNLNFDENAASNAISILENGSYTNSVITTKESNIETWMQIRNANYGAMTYLSGGFVISNLQEITNYGFKVATYNGISLTNSTITNGYDWYRPFNSIVSIEVEDYVKNWIEWAINPNNVIADKVFNQVGIIRLTNDQLNSMCSNNVFDVSDIKSFWTSDYELISIRNVISYGASA